MNIERTKATLANVPAGDYMSNAQLDFFRNLLQAQRADILARSESRKATIALNDVQPDELDRAANESARELEMRIIDRERQALKEVTNALQRITEGEFGYCSETGVEIGLERLLITPTAALCTEAMHQREAKARHYGRTA